MKHDSAAFDWAAFFARQVLALMFLMGGIWRVFQLGPLEHARLFFMEAYAESILPAWSLWTVGTAIPFFELGVGALLMLGLWRRPALIAIGFELLVITFGHLLAEPLFGFNQHVIPRMFLVIFLLSLPPALDRFSLDEWRASAGS